MEEVEDAEAEAEEVNAGVIEGLRRKSRVR